MCEWWRRANMNFNNPNAHKEKWWQQTPTCTKAALSQQQHGAHNSESRVNCCIINCNDYKRRGHDFLHVPEERVRLSLEEDHVSALVLGRSSHHGHLETWSQWAFLHFQTSHYSLSFSFRVSAWRCNRITVSDPSAFLFWSLKRRWEWIQWDQALWIKSAEAAGAESLPHTEAALHS